MHKRYSNAALAQKRVTGVPPPHNFGVNLLLHRVAFLAHHGRDEVCSLHHHWIRYFDITVLSSNGQLLPFISIILLMFGMLMKELVPVMNSTLYTSHTPTITPLSYSVIISSFIVELVLSIMHNLIVEKGVSIWVD